MPAITQEVTYTKITGMVCDLCGKVDEEGFNTFVVDHTCGYDSVLDQGRIQMTICDNCLLAIALKSETSAITDENGDAKGYVTDRLNSIGAIQVIDDLDDLSDGGC